TAGALPRLLSRIFSARIAAADGGGAGRGAWPAPPGRSASTGRQGARAFQASGISSASRSEIRIDCSGNERHEKRRAYVTSSAFHGIDGGGRPRARARCARARGVEARLAVEAGASHARWQAGFLRRLGSSLRARHDEERAEPERPGGSAVHAGGTRGLEEVRRRERRLHG